MIAVSRWQTGNFLESELPEEIRNARECVPGFKALRPPPLLALGASWAAGSRNGCGLVDSLNRHLQLVSVNVALFLILGHAISDHTNAVGPLPSSATSGGEKTS